MAIIPSIALSAFFPQSINSRDAMFDALRFVRSRGFASAEFYYDGPDKPAVANLLRELCMDAVFIAIIPLKAGAHSLCALDETSRLAAVSVACQCADDASLLGARAIMINSGTIPKDAACLEAVMVAYERSVDEIFAYMRAKSYSLCVLLEPGDSHVDAFQLLGPCERVLSSTRQLVNKGYSYGLTMDTAHICEEGEDVLETLKRTEAEHIHLCNCYLANTASPFYGDKHIAFDYPGGCFSFDSFKVLYHQILSISPKEDRNLVITLEAMCRDGDPKAFLKRHCKGCDWLFQR